MYFLNKNVLHGPKYYAKDSEIKEGDAGFKDLLSAGHVSEGKGVVASAPKQMPVVPKQAPVMPPIVKAQAPAQAELGGGPAPKILKRRK